MPSVFLTLLSMYNALMHNLQIQSQDDGTSKLQLRFHEKKNPLLAPGFDPSTFWLSFYCQVILKEDFFGYPKLCPIWITQWLVLYYSINVLSTVLAAAKNIDQDDAMKEKKRYPITPFLIRSFDRFLAWKNWRKFLWFFKLLSNLRAWHDHGINTMGQIWLVKMWIN